MANIKSPCLIIKVVTVQKLAVLCSVSIKTCIHIILGVNFLVCCICERRHSSAKVNQLYLSLTALGVNLPWQMRNHRRDARSLTPENAFYVQSCTIPKASVTGYARTAKSQRIGLTGHLLALISASNGYC